MSSEVVSRSLHIWKRQRFLRFIDLHWWKFDAIYCVPAFCFGQPNFLDCYRRHVLVATDNRFTRHMPIFTAFSILKLSICVNENKNAMMQKCSVDQQIRRCSKSVQGTFKNGPTSSEVVSRSLHISKRQRFLRFIRLHWWKFDAIIVFQRFPLTAKFSRLLQKTCLGCNWQQMKRHMHTYPHGSKSSMYYGPKACPVTKSGRPSSPWFR